MWPRGHGLNNYSPYSYRLYSYGLPSYGLNSHGLYSHALYSFTYVVMAYVVIARRLFESKSCEASSHLHTPAKDDTVAPPAKKARKETMTAISHKVCR